MDTTRGAQPRAAVDPVAATGPMAPTRHSGPRAPWPWRLLAWLLRPWLTIKTDPTDPTTAVVAEGPPVCYIMERYGVTNALILEEACRAAALPPPLLPIPGGVLPRNRSVLALSRREGWLFRRPRTRTHSGGLAQLLAAVRANPSLDIRLVPVSIFVGRAPSRTTGWFRVLFSENWAMVGRFRRLLAILLNGRDTIVHFSPAVSLRDVVGEALEPERTVRKTSRALRAHFTRIRTAVIGPDLSHRRTVIDTLINRPGVQDAIKAASSKESITLFAAEEKAREYAWEIAADYSNPVVRSLSFLLTPFWNKLYGGIEMHHFDTVKRIAPGHEVIYVPCHRSHIDYLLLSYLLYINGLVAPHIAAGVNLNLPLVGPILRRGGAFFLRRSFRANALYAAVFSEYTAQLFARGVAMEYFIEGGRSRTGRLLEPRAGMLAMTVRAYLTESRRPVMFQPVYIGYEKVMEARSYISELSGKPKEKESLWGLLSSVKVLREHYGKVAVSFGEPIFLSAHLDEVQPGWREDVAANAKPEWFNRSVGQLASKILVNINRAADVNPINLLGLTLLSAPKHAMGESDLLSALALAKSLLADVPYSDRVTVTPMTPSEIVLYAERVGWIVRSRHPLGDVLSAGDTQAVLLSYFRNNVLHLFATPAWVATCFLHNRRLRRATVGRLGRFVYPFLKNELFLPWSDDEFGQRVAETLDAFVKEGLLKTVGDGKILRRRVGQTDQAFQLRVVAQTLEQAFERYYIALALLVKNGSGVLATGELENLCHLTAQRLALIYERTAPEFFDKQLFRGFINTLKSLKIVWLSDAGKLMFGEQLTDIAADAKLILSREIRHSILKLTPEMVAKV